MARAPKGGCTGINGDSYEGGQFLPNSPTTIKGAHRSARYGKKSYTERKQEIAPYIWECPVSDDIRSLYTMLAGTLAVWENGQFKPNNERAIEYCGSTVEQTQALCDLYNTGTRWVTR